MAKRKKITDNIEEVLSELNATENKDEFRRLQCVYLGDTTPEMSLKENGDLQNARQARVSQNCSI